MVLQRFFVVGLLDIFKDVGDDRRITVSIKIHFLVIRNLADLTMAWSVKGRRRCDRIRRDVC
jgi:hypothetical protein